MTPCDVLARLGLPLVLAGTIACGSSSAGSSSVDAGAGDGSLLPDGGGGEPPLPDGVTEAKNQVPFPDGIEPFAYDRLAVGDDGSPSIAASRMDGVILLGYSPQLTRRYQTVTPEPMSFARARALRPRQGGAATLLYGEKDYDDDLLQRGYVLSSSAAGTPELGLGDAPFPVGFALGIDAQQRIILGTVEGTDAARRAVVVRKTAAGDVDESFGTHGRSVIGCKLQDTELATNAPAEVAATPDGTIYAFVVASGDVGSGFFSLNMVAKLSAAGQLDSSYGNQGCASVTFSPDAMVADADGTVWLGGVSATAHTPSALAGVMRLLPSGAVDTSFGAQGVHVFEHAAGSGSQLLAMHRRGSGVFSLVRRYVSGQKLQHDLVELNSTGVQEQTHLADTGYWDFGLSKGEKNLYYLAHDHAGRITTP